MVTPNKGIYETLTLNAEGRRVADTWDPAKDEAAGEQCRAYGAANIMRLPGRLHITWQDDNTLKIETDTGTQTRLFHFGAGQPPAAEPGLAGIFSGSVGICRRCRSRGGAARGKLEGGNDEPQGRVRAQERSTVQREGDCHRIL